MKKIAICFITVMMLLCSCSKDNQSSISDSINSNEAVTTIQKESEPVLIDMFENVNIINFFDSEYYKQMEKKEKYNIYPIYGYFTTDENPYWNEYCNTLEYEEQRENLINGKNYSLGYQIASYDIDTSGETIVLEFVDEDHKMEEFLEEHNYVIDSKRKEYYISVKECETTLISKELYTENIKSQTDRIISDTISEQYPGYEVVEKNLILPEKEEYHKTNHKTDLRLPYFDIKATSYEMVEDYMKHMEFVNLDLEVDRAIGNAGLFALIKNPETDKYAFIRVHILISQDKVIESKVLTEHELCGVEFASADEAMARLNFYYHNTIEKFIPVD